MHKSTLQFNPEELAMFAISSFGAMQKQEELQQLIQRVTHLKPRVIVEIGVGKGGTSWCWSKFADVSQVIAIDLPNGPWGGGPSDESIQYIKNNRNCINYNFIAGNSQGELEFKKVNDLLKCNAYPNGQKVDFLFIDGDHSYEGVKADYEKYSSLVRNGGLIAFHDICEHPPETKCFVKQFWDEVKVGKNTKEIISSPENWGGIGVIYK